MEYVYMLMNILYRKYKCVFVCVQAHRIFNEDYCDDIFLFSGI